MTAAEQWARSVIESAFADTLICEHGTWTDTEGHASMACTLRARVVLHGKCPADGHEASTSLLCYMHGMMYGPGKADLMCPTHGAMHKLNIVKEAL